VSSEMSEISPRCSAMNQTGLGHPIEMIEPRESFIQRKHVRPKRSLTLANQFTPEAIRAG